MLEATSFDENGQVMSLRHRTFDVRGVQFHPESVLTQTGKNYFRELVDPNPTRPSKRNRN
jgi:anthranilate synthase component 2